MNIEEIKKFLSENPESINELLSSESVGVYLDGHEDGKKLLQKRLDKHFNKSLETWKANNLESIINEEISKRHPEVTPEQKRIAELESKLKDQQRQLTMKEITVKANSYAAELGLPVQLVKHFVTENEAETMDALDNFSTLYTESLNKSVEGRITGKTPRNLSNINETKKAVKDMSFTEFAKQYKQ